MLKKKSWQRAQSMAEYAVIIAAVAAALAAMGIFMRAGLQKKVFGLSQELSDRPYIPKFTFSNSSASASSSATETYAGGVSNVTYNESSSRNGDETVLPERQ